MKLKRLKTVELIVLATDELLHNPSDEQRLFGADVLRREILRHCDTAGAVVHTHYEMVCSHCGLSWEEDADGPVCCVKAQDEWAMVGEKINQG